MALKIRRWSVDSKMTMKSDYHIKKEKIIVDDFLTDLYIIYVKRHLYCIINPLCACLILSTNDRLPLGQQELITYSTTV